MVHVVQGQARQVAGRGRHVRCCRHSGGRCTVLVTWRRRQMHCASCLRAQGPGVKTTIAVAAAAVVMMEWLATVELMVKVMVMVMVMATWRWV